MPDETAATEWPRGRWHGHWIATEVPTFEIDPSSVGADLAPAGFSKVQFRRTFELPTQSSDGVAPQQPAPMRISADSRYVLWVNGVEVGRGPGRSQPRRLRYDEYDIAAHLTCGRNVVAVLVTYYGHPNSFWQPAASNGVIGRDAHLVAEARLNITGGGEWLVTDEQWRVQRSRAWRSLAAGRVMDGVPVELLDARELDPAWVEPGFDDSDWAPAALVKVSHIGGAGHSQPPVDPYGAMLPRGTAHPTGDEMAPGTAVVQIGPALPDGPGTGQLPDHPAQRLITQLHHVAEATAATLPVTITREPAKATVVTVDFGRIVAGHVELDVDAPAGVRLDLWYQETAAYDPATGPATGPAASAPRASASYTTRGRQHPHGDRFRAAEIAGLRRISLLVPPGDGDVTLTRVAVREYRYPFVDGAFFASSDPELDRLYQAGIRTTQLNSFDAFTDCPTREQRAWVGDGVVHQMVHLVANQDWRLARNYLRLGASPRPDGMLPMSVVGEMEHGAGFAIPDWALHWIHGVWVQYRHDGDAAAALALLPVAERILRWFEPFIDEHGTLSDVPEWNLVDWSSVFTSHRSTLSTGLWARALTEYAQLCEWLGNNASVTWARTHWDHAHAGFEDFWDAHRGGYVDHIVDGHQMPAMSQHAGALAIVSGLAPRERWPSVIETITDPHRLVVRSWIGGADGGYDLDKQVEQSKGIYRIDWDPQHEIVLAQPFFSYVVHDAVAAAGRADQLPDLLRRWSQFLHDGYDTFGECWGWGTPVHAWSATPTKDLTWYVLGVTPAEPGYTTVQVAPRPGTIAQLSGAVPTPHGLVRVDIDTTTGPTGTVTVNSPVPVRYLSPSGHRTDAPPGATTFAL